MREFRERGVPHEVAVLRCGHYSTGKAPFKFVDGWVLTRFLKRELSAYQSEADPALKPDTTNPKRRSNSSEIFQPLQRGEQDLARDRRTNGDTSPSLTALATVTGLVRNSQIVAAASTMLTIAIRLTRLRLRRCRRIRLRTSSNRPVFHRRGLVKADGLHDRCRDRCGQALDGVMGGDPITTSPRSPRSSHPGRSLSKGIGGQDDGLAEADLAADRGR